IANAKGLAWYGLLCSGLPQAAHYRTLGLAILWRAIAQQTGADGGHGENSSSYHVAVWLDSMETALLCRAAGVAVPPEIITLLEKMGDFALALMRPDGRLPLLNDSIEDKPVTLAKARALAATLFKGDLWQKGKNPRLDRYFPDAGYVVLNGTTSHPLYALLDVGNLGLAYCPGHGHADALSFELWWGAEPFLLDPGTYQYPAGKWRDLFRSTAGHNTATVDGVDQSEFVGPFRLARMSKTRNVDVALDDKVMVSAEHDGYERLPQPVTHRRTWLWQRAHNPDILQLADQFLGKGKHTINLYFHLGQKVAEINENGTVTVTSKNNVKMQIQFSNELPSSCRLEAGWVSGKWYQKEEMPVVVY
ncbi:MAG: alginate lyase family protein, partial [Methylococcales bacterium]|nr:alginate lyase family protein [Methylococcales bacterium]